MWLGPDRGRCGVDYFLSTFTNRIDKKGRVSVPAEFRSILLKRGSNRLFVNRAIKFSCIEAYGEDYVDEMMKRVHQMEYESDEQDDYLDLNAAAILPLGWDTEGRIVIPDELMAHAQLGAEAQAVFAGRGNTFAIWNPTLFAARQAEARARQQARRAGASA